LEASLADGRIAILGAIIQGRHLRENNLTFRHQMLSHPSLDRALNKASNVAQFAGAKTDWFLWAN
jgi:hypothetical protein